MREEAVSCVFQKEETSKPKKLAVITVVAEVEVEKDNEML